jgi:hypothetical protein
MQVPSSAVTAYGIRDEQRVYCRMNLL